MPRARRFRPDQRFQAQQSGFRPRASANPRGAQKNGSGKRPERLFFPVECELALGTVKKLCITKNGGNQRILPKSAPIAGAKVNERVFGHQIPIAKIQRIFLICQYHPLAMSGAGSRRGRDCASTANVASIAFAGIGRKIGLELARLAVEILAIGRRFALDRDVRPGFGHIRI